MNWVALRIVFLNIIFIFNASASESCTLEGEFPKVALKKIISFEEFGEYFEDTVQKCPSSISRNFQSDLHGLYVILNSEDTKIGIVSFSDGSGTYYENKSEALGFTDGGWIEQSIFLDAGHRGQGYFKGITNAVKILASQYVGKHYKMPSKDGLVLSNSSFKGFRRLIDLHNIPALRASLKNGRVLRKLWENQDSWVVEYSFKNYIPTKEEQELTEKANKIIEESLESFRGKEFGDREIPSTDAALKAVSKYYQRTR